MSALAQWLVGYRVLGEIVLGNVLVALAFALTFHLAWQARPVRFNIDTSAPPHWFRIDSPRPARVQVDWKPEVTTAARTALEQQHSLTDAVHPKKRLIDRSIYRPMEESSLVRLQRTVPLFRISIAPRY